MKKIIETIDFPEYALDSKLNASNILMNMDKVLSDKTVAGIVIAVLYSKNELNLLDKFIDLNSDILDEDLIFAAKASATIMAMNNIYYRGKHFLGEGYKDQAAKLRMNVYQKHKVDKKDFELFSLAVSFINGCEFCVESHASLLEKDGVSKDMIHQSLRIAAIFNTIKEKY